MTKKAAPKSNEPTKGAPITKSVTNVSGGANIEADNVDVAGDVVGHDKIVGQEIKATGRNIIQIGALNIPVVPLIGALAAGVLVLIVIGLSLRSIQSQLPVIAPTPARMQRDFNIAIAEFVEEGADHQFKITDNSRRLSQSVNDTLVAELAAFPDPQLKSAIEIRYGTLPITNGLVLSETDAAVVADRLGADMVIYGSLDRAGNFTPQFYVSASVRAEIDALLTGSQRFGDQPIPFNQASSLSASTDLRTRASALFFIAAGLTYDVFGLADKALVLYRQAEQNLTDWPEIGAGKEVLYFFKGQVALFRAQQLRQTDKPAAQNLTTEAEEAFRKAIGSNQNYARAYIGLGTTFYTRLQLAPAISETLGSSEMQQMFDAYQHGQQLAQTESDHLAELVGLWSYGLGFYQQGRAYQARGDAQNAIDSYRQAIALIQGTLDPLKQLDQPRVLAQAYLGLGAVYRELAALQSSQGDTPGSRSSTDGAKAAFGQCIQIGQASQDRILKDLIAGQRCQPLYDGLINKP
ncbi:MAG TPA: hypothetical protein VFK30_15900 [Anaerolineae bacterium]|nr:hypothetical protein [Anaerolineae bacterium]